MMSLSPELAGEERFAGGSLVAPPRESHGQFWRAALWLVLVLALITGVRVLALAYNATDLFFDEAQYWSWSLEPAFGYYSKPPLIAWLIGLSTSVCGVAEYCVRLPSPLVHAATAIAVFLTGARLYGATTGMWAGIVFATLPGVSVSAELISTDVPLLMFWAIALFAFVALIQYRDAWWPALLLGVALGVGLNAKYAMAYFVLCTVVYVAATPDQRWILRDRRWWLALAIGIALIVPNLLWNAQHSFATFAHTADNAKWGGPLIHPGKALEFFGSQFGVFGPILFGALLVITVRACRFGLAPADRLLLAFALPIIIIVTVQAFLSRAHANWAAPSYVAATILVTATMIRDVAWRWLVASLVLHLAVLAGFAVATTQARTVHLPGLPNPFSRTLGWAELGRATQARLDKARAAGAPFGAVVTLDRSITAELLYYMRGARVPVLAWPPTGRPKDHYQLTRPLKPSAKGPYLLVVEGRVPKFALARFRDVGSVEHVTLPAGAGATRQVEFIRVDGFRGIGDDRGRGQSKGQ